MTAVWVKKAILAVCLTVVSVAPAAGQNEKAQNQGQSQSPESAEPVKRKFDGVKWATVTKTGSNAFINSDFGLAERSFKEALEEVKLAPTNDLRIAESCNNMGVLLVSRGQAAKAEPYFEKAARIRELALGAFDQDVIAGQGKLAQFYLNQGKRDKAFVLVNKIADYGDNESKQLNEIAGSFKRLSNYYQSHKKLEEYEVSVKQAEEKTLSTMKAQAVETAVILDSVGNAIKDVGAEKGRVLAERLFKAALLLRERTLSSQHAAMASSLENLGKLFAATGRSAQAEPLLKRAYDISLATLGPDRRETQLRLDNLAQVNVSLGNLSEAEGLYRKILDSQEKGAKKNSPDLLANFASLLCKQGRYSDSIPYYARALKIQESLNGPQHASVATLLDSYAYALAKCNRGAEAQKCQARAKSIRG